MAQDCWGNPINCDSCSPLSQCVCMCVCVSERERERKRQCLSVCVQGVTQKTLACPGGQRTGEIKIHVNHSSNMSVSRVLGERSV